MTKVIRNYFRTYWKLVADWYAHSPSNSRFILLASLIVGLASNLPFLLFAWLITKYSQGFKTVDLVFSDWNISILLVDATYATFAISIFIFYLQYAVRKRALRYCLDWQAKVLQRLIVSLISYPDVRVTRLLLPDDPRKLTALLISSVKSLPAIERLTSLGISHISLMLVASLTIIFLDPIVLVQIVMISVCFLPVYATLFIRMIKLRSGGKKFIAEQRNSLTDFVINNGMIDQQKIEKKTENFSSLYELSNLQMISLNSIGFLTKIHVLFLASMVATSAFYSAQSQNLDFFLIVAILMLARAGIGITSLFARLARNYLNIAIASKMLHPRKKPSKVAVRKARYLLDKLHLNSFLNQQFVPVFFVGVENLKYSWQIVPITNLIMPYEIMLHQYKYGLSVSLNEQKGILFVTPKAFKFSDKASQLDTKRKERIVFVCLTVSDECFAKDFFQASDHAVLVAKNGVATVDSVGKCLDNMQKNRRSNDAEFDQFQEDEEEDL